MATEAVFVTGNLNTGATGTVDLTSTGFGTPTAAVIFVTGAGTSQNPDGDWQSSIGFWTSSAQTSLSNAAADGVGTTNTSRSIDALRAVSFVNNNGSSWITLSTASAITDGIRLTNIFHDGTNSEYVSALLIKGTTNVAVGNEQLVTSSEVVTLGFQPDVIFGITDANNSTPDRATNLMGSFGVVHWDSVGTKVERWLGFGSPDAQGQTDSNVVLYNDAFCGQGFNNTVTWRGSAGSPTSTGFTVTSTGTTNSDYVHYLALKLADADDFNIQTITARTTTGTQAFTGAGFTPDVVGSILAGNTTINTSVSHARFGVGLSDGTTDQLLYLSDQDASSGTNNQSGRAAKALGLPSVVTGTQIEADLQSLDSDGWTYDYTTVDGTARLGFAFAIGDSTAGGGPTTITGTGALAAQSSAIAGTGEITHTGTGSLSAQAVTIAGTGTVGTVVAGTGALASQAATVTGVGEIVHTGTAALAAQTATISGTGTVTAPGVIVGTAALAAQASSIASVGTLTRVGTGTLAAEAATIAGVGSIVGTVTGTGALTAQASVIAGVGIIPQAITGTGALVCGASSISGSQQPPIWTEVAAVTTTWTEI